MHVFLRNYDVDTYVYKQSIGFIGPGVSLLCLNYANTPTAAAVLLTIALCLSSFSQAGFLLYTSKFYPTNDHIENRLINGVDSFLYNQLSP